MRRSRVFQIGCGLSGAAGLLILAGCTGQRAGEPVNAGLDALSRSGPAVSRVDGPSTQGAGAFDLEDYARDLQRMLAEYANPPSREVVDSGRASEVAALSGASDDQPWAYLAQESPQSEAMQSAREDAPDEPEPAVADVVEEAVAPSVSIDARIAGLADDLRALLVRRAEDSMSPMSDAMLAALLESLSLGGVSGALEAIAPAERKAIEHVREFMVGMEAWSRGDGLADPAALAQSLADRLAADHGLRIRQAALCTRVMGFGRFVPVDSTTLLAGRATRLVLYTEIERFAHRTMSQSHADAALSVVEISQELNLWHDAPTPILAWRRSEERVEESLRGVRRDFYLVQPVEFPPTLSVGAYVLKVHVRDRVSGAQAEAAIPIRVVADPALTHAGAMR